MNYIDQMGRSIHLGDSPPQRIVSLVPSQTELLADLGLEKEVVGITKFCVHPADWFHSKKRVGGTKTLDFQKIEALRPDLIIGNKEENEQSQIEFLAARYPVWMSDIHHLKEALEMIRGIGALTGKPEKANAIATEVERCFAQNLPTEQSPQKAAYLIWRKPYMVAGSDTFIDDMLQRAGFENVFKDLGRYPEISLAQLADAQPSVLLLSSEPYPFSEKHKKELQEICPGTRVMLVDGEMFSWYGSRLLQAPGYFVGLKLNG